MKAKISIFICLSLFVLGMKAEDVTVTWKADDQGINNKSGVDGRTFNIDENTTLTFNKGGASTAPTYYTGAVRVYGGGSFSVAGKDITQIKLTFATSDGSNTITAGSGGTYTNGTWTGKSDNVTFNIGGSSGHRKIAEVIVTYTGEGGGEEPPVEEKTDTIAGINALKQTESGKEVCLYLSPESNARVVYAKGGEVYLRDKSGAICLNIDYDLFNPKPAHNQHVAGWITGRYSDEDGLPQLLATENTNTKNILFAEPVTEPVTEPEIVEAEEFGAYYADWILLKDLRINGNDATGATGEIDGFEFTLTNRFGLTSDLYIMPQTGSLVNVSGIAYPVGNTDHIAPIAMGGIPAVEVTEASGINSQLTIDNSQFDGVIYNLTGQRVTHPARGIYIVNGKKVFIK